MLWFLLIMFTLVASFAQVSYLLPHNDDWLRKTYFSSFCYCLDVLHDASSSIMRCPGCHERRAVLSSGILCQGVHYSTRRLRSIRARSVQDCILSLPHHLLHVHGCFGASERPHCHRFRYEEKLIGRLSVSNWAH